MTRRSFYKPGSATIALNKRPAPILYRRVRGAGLALQGWESKISARRKANIGTTVTLYPPRWRGTAVWRKLCVMAVASFMLYATQRTRKLLLKSARELDSLYGRKS